MTSLAFQHPMLPETFRPWACGTAMLSATHTLLCLMSSSASQNLWQKSAFLLHKQLQHLNPNTQQDQANACSLHDSIKMKPSASKDCSSPQGHVHVQKNPSLAFDVPRLACTGYSAIEALV